MNSDYMKNVYILSLTGWNDFIPVLWPSAKTYYELNGKYPKKYNWVVPVIEMYRDVDEIKKELRETPPDIFGVSLYVWNYEKSLSLCKWVKEQWPNCLVITGGPHQYFKHHADWFSKHWFIDASLPSDVYGEIAICDLLDNLKDTNLIDWNTVEQMVYPNKNKTLQLRSPKATYKRDFKWNFSAFDAQKEHLEVYVKSYYDKVGGNALHSKIETTRGCPYECTFCDWGGGLGTKVVLKDIECVRKDLDVLLNFNISGLYVCDANFGINGDRDVGIISYIAERKQSYPKDKMFPIVQYGGFAKTNKHFDYLKQIFTIEAKNNLSYVYKISQQSFTQEILDNVKRTDFRENEHFELAEYLRTNYSYDATLELIVGLPGTTLDTWYNEFNKPYEYRTVIRAYEWYLLPEAEAFGKAYREKFKIGTAKKWFNTEDYTIPSEIVVSSSTFSRDDYKDMLTIYSWYIMFVQTGVYKKTIDNILEQHNIKFGDFLKKFYNECYPLIKTASGTSLAHYDDHISKFVEDGVNSTLHNIYWNNEPGVEIDHVVYFIVEFFKKFELLSPIIEDWLYSLSGDRKLLDKESALIYSETRLHTVKRSFFTKVKFNAFKDTDEFMTDALRTTGYTYGSLLVANREFALL